MKIKIPLLDAVFFDFSRKKSNEDGKKQINVKWQNGRYREVVSNFMERVPGALEQDVFYICLYYAQNDKQIPSCSDMARLIGKNPQSYCQKIKIALDTLVNCQYELKNILSETSQDSLTLLQKIENRYVVNSTIVKIESGQWVDMDYYFSLPFGIPRRMFLMLEKKKKKILYGFEVTIEHLANWVPSIAKATGNKKRTLEKAMGKLQDAGYLKWSWDKSAKKYNIFFLDFGKNRRSVTRENVDCGSKENLVKSRVAEAPKNTTTKSRKTDRITVKKSDMNFKTTELYNQLTPENKEQYKNCVDWLKEASCSFELSRLNDIDPEDLVANFPNVKKRYEQDQKEGLIKDTNRFLYKALKDGYEPRPEKQQKEQASSLYELENYNADKEIETLTNIQGILDNLSKDKTEIFWEQTKAEEGENYLLAGSLKTTFIRNVALGSGIPFGNIKYIHDNINKIAINAQLWGEMQQLEEKCMVSDDKVKVESSGSDCINEKRLEALKRIRKHNQGSL